MSGVARVALLEQELYKIDGESSGASHPWLEASSFHLSRSISTTSFLSPSSSFIFLATTQFVSPFFILQSHMITALQVPRIKGFKGHKLSSEWISFEGNFFYTRGRQGEKDWQ